jgi:hypothetical protein
MTDAVPSRSLSFAGGMVAFAWVAMAVLGPIALFTTWWGDCFAEVCPYPTQIDLWVYRLDVVGWVAVGILGAIAVVRRHRLSLVVVAALGMGFAAQGAAGFLGARGFSAFPIILPASMLLIGGGIAGARALSATPPPWAAGTTTMAVGLGCQTHFAAFLCFVGISESNSGQLVGLLLIALAVAILFTLARSLAANRD